MRVISFLLALILIPSLNSAMRIFSMDDVINTQTVKKDDFSKYQTYDKVTTAAYDGMDASLRQYLTYYSYTMNQKTPGYKRASYANYWDGKRLTQKRFIQPEVGPIIHSRNPFHAYIQGHGYLYAKTPQGMGFTSDARMERDQETGKLITLAGGYDVMGIDDQPIILESYNIYIATTGEIFDNDTKVGQLKFVRPYTFNEVHSFNNVLFYTPTKNLETVPKEELVIRGSYFEAAAVPVGLSVGESGIYQHIYKSSTYVAKRNIRALRRSVRLQN